LEMDHGRRRTLGDIGTGPRSGGCPVELQPDSERFDQAQSRPRLHVLGRTRSQGEALKEATNSTFYSMWERIVIGIHGFFKRLARVTSIHNVQGRTADGTQLGNVQAYTEPARAAYILTISAPDRPSNSFAMASTWPSSNKLSSLGGSGGILNNRLTSSSGSGGSL